jgi:hypothetical protein
MSGMRTANPTVVREIVRDGLQRQVAHLGEREGTPADDVHGDQSDLSYAHIEHRRVLDSKTPASITQDTAIRENHETAFEPAPALGGR